MLRVLQDTCGRHDTFGMACTARGYEERGFPGHLNCSDNISYALNPFSVPPAPLGLPSTSFGILGSTPTRTTS
jgi:aminomethyltransferase